jgi:methylenetetrahydrofolate dehydrogenase (NADP+)/methenyltetrahydrofolate cyclohydrolase
MTAKLLDGKLLAEEIKLKVKQRVSEVGIPTLAVVLVGDDPASAVYVSSKKKACEFTGIRSLSYELSADTSEDKLLELVDELNSRGDVDGILVQLPLPGHIKEDKVLLRIKPEKDVDAFHPYNVGMLSIGRPTFKPCTPAGVIELINKSGVDIAGKNCVVVGRSNIVGKPVSALLLAENGTVTTCHSRTANLAEVCASADILVAALGKPKFITADMIKAGAVVIDVGIHRMENKKLCGDVDFDACKDKAGFITPVPGGVGPMTIAMLMNNCLEAYINRGSH